jgi:hypothetical protein
VLIPIDLSVDKATLRAKRRVSVANKSVSLEQARTQEFGEICLQKAETPARFAGATGELTELPTTNNTPVVVLCQWKWLKGSVKHFV